jgi:hypothetical protein
MSFIVKQNTFALIGDGHWPLITLFMSRTWKLEYV